MVSISMIIPLGLMPKSVPGDHKFILDKVLLPSAANVDLGDYNVEPVFPDKTYILYPNVIMNIKLVQYARFVCQSNPNETIISLIAAIRRSEVFALEVHYYMWALLLNSSPLQISDENWQHLLDELVAVVLKEAPRAKRLIYLILHYLAHCESSEKRNKLLLALVSFAKFAENWPIILHTLNEALDRHDIFRIELYTRLWMVQPTKYQFLENFLHLPDHSLTQNGIENVYISKMKAINTIVQHK